MNQDQSDRWSALDEDGRSEYTDMGPGALPSGEIEASGRSLSTLEGAPVPRPARAFLRGWRLPGIPPGVEIAAGMFAAGKCPEGWRYSRWSLVLV